MPNQPKSPPSNFRILLVWLAMGLALCGSVSASDFQTQLEWLPKGHSFPIRYLDPQACQQTIQALSYEVEGDSQQRLYVPISLSMRQQFLRYAFTAEKHFELGLAFSIFNQFSIIDAGEAFMGGLQNADYRVSAVVVYTQDPSTHYRMSLFHQSSHLGDDYIIRNEITTATLRTLNYEQLDLTLSKSWGAYRGYLGLGYNVSPHTVRGRGTFQIGADLTNSIQSNPGIAFKAAFDSKWHEQLDYSPNLRIGMGLELARQTQTPFIVMLTWYSGHLPYSTLEYQKVKLMGLSLFIDLDRS